MRKGREIETHLLVTLHTRDVGKQKVINLDKKPAHCQFYLLICITSYLLPKPHFDYPIDFVLRKVTRRGNLAFSSSQMVYVMLARVLFTLLQTTW